MDDEQDVQKMTIFINKQKSAYQSNFQLEFQDFVNFKQDYSDHEFDDDLDDEIEEDNFYEFNVANFQTEKLSDQESVFTEDEQHTIESCTDPDLKKLLILNRSKNLQLIKLHKKMQEFLKECEEEIEEKNCILKNADTKHLSQQTCIWKLTAPYFKDKKFFPCPPNQDTVRKRARNELSVYDIVPSPKWTPIEFDRLTNAIKCNYNIKRQNDIVVKITSLKSKIQNEECENKNMTQELISLKEQLEELKDDEKIPPLNSDDCIDWYKVAETFLKDKHTALECQSVWHILVHPQINKSEWTDEENKSLEAIAKDHSYQNWDDIALELDTNRTGFTTCLHYFSKLCDKFKRTKFTPEEDRFLLDVVDIYKVGNFIPWNKVVCHFTKRSRHQLYHRYTYFLSQNHVKRGKFSESEDILLIILVNKFGRNFKKCAEYMPHRSLIQLKSRYNSNLQRHIRKGTFTTEDDEMIYEWGQKHGEKNWSGLTGVLNRCNAQIRQRYKLIKNFLRVNAGSKVADIPKRRHRFDETSEGQYNFLNYVAEQYRDVKIIPTLSMIEESFHAELGTATSKKTLPNEMREIPLDSPQLKVKSIDELLTDFFSVSMKTKQYVITEANLKEATENAEEVLNLLGANLKIPENLECNVYFDNIDLEILERISNSSRSKVDQLIPPNINTLVGLRSLIIKHKEYKSRKCFAATSKCDLTLRVDQPNKKEISFHQELFSKRFDVLFDWSAVLSLEKPNHFDVSDQSKSTEILNTSQIITTKRRPGSECNPVVKKQKLDASVLANLSQHPRLKVVDKRVVENLVKKNNISVIRLDSVVRSDVINSATCKQLYPVEETPQALSTEIDISESVIDVRDLHDVESLNMMLRKMKSEVNSGPSNYNEEYKTIKDDVQRLKQILKHEKVKVKPDPDEF